MNWRDDIRLGLFGLTSVTVFENINHQGILFKFYPMGIGGSVLSVLTQFLFNLSQHVVVDGCRSKLVNVVSRVIHCSVKGPELFLLYTGELFPILEYKLSGYADD